MSGDIYGGFVNQYALLRETGHKGRVNPVAKKGNLNEVYARSIAVRELQQFVRRYKYTNLPKGLTPELIERILYYRGRLVLFKMDDTYYALPFALNGGIDVYGRYNAVTPLTFNGSIATDDDGNEGLQDGIFMDKVLNVAYDINALEGKDCVILNDYTQGISQFIVPRYQLNYIYHTDLANIIILIKHNLISSARVYTLRVTDQGQKEAVEEELSDMENDILQSAKRVFTVTASTKLEEILQDKKLETQQYWECYVSWDNLRENLIGIENNGVFKKKERQLKGEQELEASSADLVYEDGLVNRRSQFEIFNAMFGENVIVEESEVIMGIEEMPNETLGKEDVQDGSEEE